MSSTESRPDVFDRAAGAVGHLDHPLYDDEHQRDVWNEASAVGFQAVTWALLLAATAAVWLGGRAALPYAMTMTAIGGVAGIVVMLYAQRRGVDSWRSPGTGRLRWTLIGLVGLLLLTGMVRAVEVHPEAAGVTAAAAAGVVGAGTVLLLTLVAMRLARRRAPRGED